MNGTTRHQQILYILYIITVYESSDAQWSHFFLPPLSPSSLRSQEMTLPSITTQLPSMKATRERPSQFLKVSQTSGCWGWKEHWAISFDFSACGSSIFLPPVSLPIFHLSAEIRQAERPQRTKPMGE